MICVDFSNNKLIGVSEQVNGNQYIPAETTIKPDSSGYYNLYGTHNGERKLMHFRIINGKIVP